MPKGHFVRTEAHKRAISEALKGRKHTEEHRRKNAEAHTGIQLSEEHRQKLSEAMRVADHPNRHGFSEEHRHNLSEAKKRKSALLRRYGIDPEEYTRQLDLGNKWCCYGKHFAPDTGFPSRMGVCAACKSDFYRESDLRRKYGVTHEWYVAKLAEQKGVCAICKRAKIANGDKHFHVDHDHDTGAVRGLLCSACNTVLGCVESIPDWIMSIAGYLAQYRNPQ